MSVEAELLRDIRDLLKSIDAKLTPPPAKPGYKVKLGRVFANGDTIPDDVDLVMGAGGMRWARVYGTDQWHMRDVEGPVVTTNGLLSLAKHVTEILPPSTDAT